MQFAMNTSYRDGFVASIFNLTTPANVYSDFWIGTIISKILITVTYVVGITGNLLALIHLCQKRNFKNSKHAIMLKCLITSDFIGLLGMASQHQLKIYQFDLYMEHLQLFCIGRILWRFFGLSSGSVALVMALERWFALTKPFLYYKYITNGMIKKMIFTLWFFVGIITFCPVVGFGTYWETNIKCKRYRDATDIKDVIYAYIFFVFGTFLCISILIYNYSVAKILYRSYQSMKSTLSSVNFAHSIRSNSSLLSKNRFSNLTAHSGSLVTSDEIRFAKLMILLSITFVVSWGSQMLTIPLYTVYSTNSRAVNIFYVFADILMLVHFMFDPFIYVLLKTNYWITFKKFICLKIRDDKKMLPVGNDCAANKNSLAKQSEI